MIRSSSVSSIIDKAEKTPVNIQKSRYQAAPQLTERSSLCVRKSLLDKAMARSRGASMTDRMFRDLNPARKSQFDEIKGDLEEAFDDLKLPSRAGSPIRQQRYEEVLDFSIDLTKIEHEEDTIRTPPQAQHFDISPFVTGDNEPDPQVEIANEKYEKLRAKYRDLKKLHSKSEVENKSTIDYLNSELTHYKNAYEDALLKIAELEAKSIQQKIETPKANKNSEFIIKSLIQKVEGVQEQMANIKPFGASRSNVLGDENGRKSSLLQSHSHKKSKSQIPKINLKSINSSPRYSELSSGSENLIMKEIAAMKERLFKAETDNSELRYKVEGLCKK